VGPGREQNRCKGIFFQTEEGSPLLFRTKGGDHIILNCLGKKGEAEDWGKREFPGSTHEGLLVTTAVQVNPAQGQYCSTGSEG
jgi:hypothetical protein